MNSPVTILLLWIWLSLYTIYYLYHKKNRITISGQIIWRSSSQIYQATSLQNSGNIHSGQFYWRKVPGILHIFYIVYHTWYLTCKNRDILPWIFYLPNPDRRYTFCGSYQTLITGQIPYTGWRTCLTKFWGMKRKELQF